MKNIGIIFSSGIYYSDLDLFELDLSPAMDFIESKKGCSMSVDFIDCVKAFVKLLKDVENLYILDMEKDIKGSGIIRLYTGMIIFEYINHYNENFTAGINYLDARKITELEYENSKLSDMKFDEDNSINLNLIFMFGLKLAYDLKIYDELKYMMN